MSSKKNNDSNSSEIKEELFINLKTDERIKDDRRRRLDFYFPIGNRHDELKHLHPTNIEQLKLTYEGIYSITRPEQGVQFIRLFNGIKNDLKDYTMIDGTAGLGGDIIYMGHFFKKCIAFEINPVHAAAIIDNTKAYGIKTTVVNKDFTLEYDKYLDKNTILWLDPPWGGPEKWREDNLKLFFYGEKPLYVNSFIDKCFDYDVTMIILKCPIKTYIDDIKEKHRVVCHIIKQFADGKSRDLFQLVLIQRVTKAGKRGKRVIKK